MAIKISQAGFGLITAFFLARTFGAEIFGFYSFAIATTTLAAVFTRFGFHTYVIYAINSALVDDRKGDIATIIFTALIAATVLSILGGLILYIATVLQPDWVMSQALQYGVGLICMVALLQITSGLIQATGNVVLGLALESIFKPILFLSMTVIGLFVLSPEEIGYGGLILTYFAAELIIIICALVTIWRWFHKEIGIYVINKKQILQNLHGARPYLLANAMIQLYLNAGILAMGIWFTPTIVGLFRVAQQVAALIPFGLQALQSVMRPRVARMYKGSDEDRRELQKMITSMTRLLCLVQTPVVIAALFFSDFIASIFGPEFSEAANIIVILAIGQTVSVICGLNGVALNMTGRAHINARWSAIALLVVAASMWPLVQIYGQFGPAIAVSFSQIVWNTGLVYAAARYAGLHTTILGNLPIKRN